MNKRIESLRKEAGLTPCYEDQSGQIQKFAELIVKECWALVDYDNKQYIKAQFKEIFRVKK